MALPLLLFEHVTARHLNQVLFSDLNLRIEPGQHWALVGPSGAGKSALLAALAGQVLLTGGTMAYPGLTAIARQRHPAGPPATWQQAVSLVGTRAPFQARAGGGELFYQQRYDATAAQEVPTVREYLLAKLPASVDTVPAGPAAWTHERTVNLLSLNTLQNQPLIQLSNGETKRLRLAAALLRNPALLFSMRPSLASTQPAGRRLMSCWRPRAAR